MALILDWLLILLASYFSGHIVQALANLLMKLLKSPENIMLSKTSEQSLPEPLINKAKSKVKKIIDDDTKEINSDWLFRICDEYVVQNGSLGDREIFVYREGFYRGWY